MGKIEEQVRHGISRTKADDTNSRNQVYMAARDVIFRFPEDQQPALVQELAEAVKAIEFEYARLELASTSPQGMEKRGEPFGQTRQNHGPATSEALSPIAEEKGMESTLGPRRLTLPAIAVVVVLALGFSTYLLFQQLGFLETGNGGADALEVGTVESAAKNASRTSPKSGGIKNLLNYENRKEMAVLSSSALGNQPLVPHELDDPGKAAISLPPDTQVYGSRPIRLEKGQLYLMRFQIRVSPPDAAVDLNAGFVRAMPDNEDVDTVGKNLPDAFFVHQGRVQKSNPKASADTLLFSGIAEWKDIHKNLGLTGNSGLVRPAIHAKAHGKAKLWLVSMSVSEL